MAKKGIRLIPIMPAQLFSADTTKAFAAMNNAVRDTVADGQRFISDYPSKPGRSRYRRTGTLRRSWTFNMKSGGRRIEGAVNSNSRIAPYNRDVQGENQRPVFDKIGWRTVVDLAKVMADDLPGKVQRALGRAFG